MKRRSGKRAERTEGAQFVAAVRHCLLNQSMRERSFSGLAPRPQSSSFIFKFTASSLSFARKSVRTLEMEIPFK